MLVDLTDYAAVLRIESIFYQCFFALLDSTSQITIKLHYLQNDLLVFECTLVQKISDPSKSHRRTSWMDIVPAAQAGRFSADKGSLADRVGADASDSIGRRTENIRF